MESKAKSIETTAIKRARSLGAPAKRQVDKENLLPNQSENPRNAATQRDKLLRSARESHHVNSRWIDLFNFQHKILKGENISPEKESYEQSFTRQLAKDTSDLPQNSHLKLNAWLSLAAFFRSHVGSSATLRVYHYIQDKRIGVFYRQLYETWANFEYSRGNYDDARKILDTGVAKKALKQEQAKEILEIFDGSKRATEPSSNANGGSMKKISVAKQISSQPLSTSSPPAKKTKPSISSKRSVQLSTSKASGLRNLGRAVRVVRSGEASSDTTKESTSSAVSRLSVPTEEVATKKTLSQHTSRRFGKYLPRISEEHTVDVKELDRTNAETPFAPARHLSEVSTPRNAHQPSFGQKAERPSSASKGGKLGDLSYILEWDPTRPSPKPKSDGATHFKSSITSRRSFSGIKGQPLNQTDAPKRGDNQGDAKTQGSMNRSHSSAVESGSELATVKEHRDANAIGSSSDEGDSSDADQLKPTPITQRKSPQMNIAAQQRDSLGSRGSRVSLDSNPSSRSGGMVLTETGHGIEVPGVEGTVSADPRVVSMFSLRNIMYVNNRPYVRLCRSGKGGSSKVYKVLTTDGQVLALKKIKLQRTDLESLQSYQNEITLLKRLRGNPRIIEQIDAEINMEKRYIAVVMEFGEIDLNQLMQERRSLAHRNGSAAAISTLSLSINFIRLTWMNMLEAVHAIHEERIVHGDLKPANFLFVQGRLKLIDFGIAKAISNDTTNIVRDTQVGTLNYMSPEAIAGTSSGFSSRGGTNSIVKLGRASDIWSLGCILYQMVYGHTPFSSLKMIQKIHAITDPTYKIPFPEFSPKIPALLMVMKSCLEHDSTRRPGIVGTGGLLEDAFLNPGVSS